MNFLYFYFGQYYEDETDIFKITLLSLIICMYFMGHQ